MGEENREVILRGETLPAKQEVVFAPDYILDIDPHRAQERTKSRRCAVVTVANEHGPDGSNHSVTSPRHVSVRGIGSMTWRGNEFRCCYLLPLPLYALLFNRLCTYFLNKTKKLPSREGFFLCMNALPNITNK
jgi:hypothetical protein